MFERKEIGLIQHKIQHEVQVGGCKYIGGCGAGHDRQAGLTIQASLDLDDAVSLQLSTFCERIDRHKAQEADRYKEGLCVAHDNGFCRIHLHVPSHGDRILGHDPGACMGKPCLAQDPEGIL
jgi:hypothetical protein